VREDPEAVRTDRVDDDRGDVGSSPPGRSTALFSRSELMVAPGQRTETPIGAPSASRSCLSVSDSPTTANFDAEYIASSGYASSPPTDAVLTQLVHQSLLVGQNTIVAAASSLPSSKRRSALFASRTA
jgi:hypothetical protein